MGYAMLTGRAHPSSHGIRRTVALCPPGGFGDLPLPPRGQAAGCPLAEEMPACLGHGHGVRAGDTHAGHVTVPLWPELPVWTRRSTLDAASWQARAGDRC